MKKLIFLLLMVTAITSHARSWEALQEIAEDEYLGSSRIGYYRLDAPVSEVILSNVDNPIAILGYGVAGTLMYGDDDAVEIHLISETGLSALNCYFLVTESDFHVGKLNKSLLRCRLQNL
jgi:hypothetical protein